MGFGDNTYSELINNLDKRKVSIEQEWTSDSTSRCAKPLIYMTPTKVNLSFNFNLKVLCIWWGKLFKKRKKK